MKELKVKVGFNDEGKVIYIEAKNQAPGKTVDQAIMICQLYTPAEMDREMKESMEDGRCYRKEHGRIRETR